MNTQIGNTTIVLLLAFALFAGLGFAPVVHAEEVPVCSLNAGAGDLLYDWSDQYSPDDRLLANAGPDAREMPLWNTPVPEGNYKVIVQSFDNHTDHPGQNQKEERWFLQLRGASHQFIANVGTTRDVPEEPVNYITDVLASNFEIPNGVAYIRANHKLPGGNEPESVRPVCALFERIPEPAQCSLVATGDDILVDFTTFPDSAVQIDPKKIVSNNSINHAKRGPENFAIPTGHYKVTLQSYDENQTSQPREQYQLDFLNTIGSVLASSGAIDDRADGTVYTQTVVNNSLFVPEGITKLRALHSAHVDNSNPNSIEPVCALLEPEAPTDDARLTLIKNVINDNGGIADEFDFKLFIDKEGPANIKFPIQVTSQETTILQPGTYNIYEEVLDGYDPEGWTGKGCESIDLENGKVKLSADQHITCTITNNDEGVVTNVADVTIKKEVRVAGDASYDKDAVGFVGDVFFYRLVYKNLGDIQAVNTVITDSGISTSGNVLTDYAIVNPPEHGTCNATVDGIYCDLGILPADPVTSRGVIVYKATSATAGSVHNVAEIMTSTEESDYSNNDDFADVLVIEEGKATLTLTKHVINDDGGTALPDDFNLTINTIPITSPIHAISGVPVVLPAGEYVVTETNLDGYISGVWGGHCTQLHTFRDDGTVAGTVTLESGDHKECEITNDDDEVTQPKANVYIEKTVTPSGGSVGATFTYTLTFGNNEVRDAHDVVINDYILQSLGVVGDYTITKQPDPGHGTCTVFNASTSPDALHIMNCDIGTLASGEIDTIEYTAVGVGEGTADNFAQIETITPETTTVDNTDNASVTVVEEGGRKAEISITKTVDPSSGQQYDTFTYTLTYDSFGPRQAANVKIEDRFQEEGLMRNINITKQPDHSGVDPLDDACVVYERNDNDMGIDCDLGTLIAGSHGTIKYQAEARVEEATVNNVVVISTTSDGDDLSNNTDDAVITISNGGGGCTSNCGGGGGRPKPKVYLFSNPQVLGTSISLSSVPYTGVGSTLAAISFILGLAVITGGGTYFLIRRKKLANAQTAIPEPRILNEVVSNIPQAAPAVVVQMQTTENEPAVNTLERVATDNQTLISTDGARTILSSENNDEMRAVQTLKGIIERAKGKYATEDGWMLLNQNRIADLLFSSELSATPLFIQWIVEGNQDKAFGFLRTMVSQGRKADDFLRKVVYELDRAYQGRLEGSDADKSVVDTLLPLANKDLEALITGLVRAVDGGYSTGITGAKVALTRMFEERARALANSLPKHPNFKVNSHQRNV